jgi:hypothetical protein
VTVESDSYQPKDAEGYERMLRFMRTAAVLEDLNTISLMYILDQSYAREDIAAALHLVEREKGFV